MNPEGLGGQGVLDILGFLGHLEDQEHRSLEDLDPLSPLVRPATLDNVEIQSFSKKNKARLRSVCLWALHWSNRQVLYEIYSQH